MNTKLRKSRILSVQAYQGRSRLQMWCSAERILFYLDGSMQDWIKVQSSLARHPKVCVMGDLMSEPQRKLGRYVNQNLQCDMAVTRNITRNAVIGACVTVWSVLRHRGHRIGDDLVIERATLSTLDDISELPGFGDAMESVGWAVCTEFSLRLPRFFEDLNVETSKAAERQKRYRERKKAAASVTSPLSTEKRESKRREEKNEKSTDCVDSASESDGLSVREKKFVAKWNTLEGVRKNRAETLSTARRKQFRTRLKDRDYKDWPKDAAEAMEKFPLTLFNGPNKDRDWKPNIEWFLRPESVLAILEGKYDFSTETGYREGSEADQAARAEREKLRARDKAIREARRKAREET